MHWLFFFVVQFVSFSFLHVKTEAAPPEFVVVIASYNNGSNNNNMCLKNLASIFCQTYPKFSVIYIDDCSTDNTGTLVEDFIRSRKIQQKIRVIHNTVRKGALQNTYEAIHSIEPYKIVVLVDGDDMLAHSRVLEKLAVLYSNKNVWLTSGRFKFFPSGEEFIAPPIPPEAIRDGNFRHYHHIWQHLRTFYAKLFQLIKKEDLLYKGNFYPSGSDHAFMKSIFEMASQGHFVMLEEVMYIYYVNNPINDFRVNKALQEECYVHIKLRPPYKPLQSLF
jgi:glycosyltransferase involved in cell wall biosynthesis